MLVFCCVFHKAFQAMGKIKHFYKDIDQHIGRKIALYRKAAGMSQSTLGSHLRITFQQVQKYEKGTNRVAMSTLLAIADILGVSVYHFLDGHPLFEKSKATLPTPEGITLMQSINIIDDQPTRKKISGQITPLIKALEMYYQADEIL